MGYRYIGAKTQVLDEVLAGVKRLARPSGHIVDLMCGTGAVSLALRQAATAWDGSGKLSRGHVET